MKLKTSIFLSIFIPSVLAIISLGVIFYSTLVTTAKDLSYSYDKLAVQAVIQLIALYELDGIITEEELVQLRKNISEIKLADSGYVYVLDKNGTFIIHPSSVGKNVSSVEPAITILANKSGYMDYIQTISPGPGRLKYIYYDNIEELDWKVVGGTYADELEKAIIIPIIFIILILILTLLDSIFISIYLTNFIYKPIKKSSDEITALTLKINTQDIKDEIRARISDIVGPDEAVKETLRNIKKSISRHS